MSLVKSGGAILIEILPRHVLLKFIMSKPLKTGLVKQLIDC